MQGTLLDHRACGYIDGLQQALLADGVQYRTVYSQTFNPMDTYGDRLYFFSCTQIVRDQFGSFRSIDNSVVQFDLIGKGLDVLDNPRLALSGDIYDINALGVGCNGDDGSIRGDRQVECIAIEFQLGYDLRSDWIGDIDDCKSVGSCRKKRYRFSTG